MAAAAGNGAGPRMPEETRSRLTGVIHTGYLYKQSLGRVWPLVIHAPNRLSQNQFLLFPVFCGQTTRTREFLLQKCLLLNKWLLCSM